jgi:Uma2 family endonuclease
MDMITEPSINYFSIVSQMPPDASVVFHNVSWEEYEELLDQIGDANSLHISYNDGTLKVMSPSSFHEKYALFINRLISQISFRFRINILFFGTTTIRKRRKNKGKEPDACFYVQTADLIGHRIKLDFASDPPPDVVVEIDIHHDSRDSFQIYSALGVPEIWRYDGQEMTIYYLHQDEYVMAEASHALPMLTGRILADYLARMLQDGELAAIIAFDEWLQSLPQ